MTQEEFLELAEAYELGHVGRQLLSTALPALRVREKAFRPSGPSDNSFVGGIPKPLPHDWPRFQETPLTFVGQVDCLSVPAGVCPAPLPRGLLQFFVPTAGRDHYEEPTLDCGRVILVHASALPAGGCSPPHLREGVAPAAEPTGPEPSAVSALLGLFRKRALRSQDQRPTLPHDPLPQRSFDWEVFPSLYGSAPDPDALWLPEGAEAFDLAEEADEDSFFEFRGAVLDTHRGGPKLQMYGFPYAVQPCVEDMQLTVNTAAGNRSPSEYQDWILLFNLNSSGGGLAPEALSYYYWIHRDDLAEGNFEEVWLCVQQD